MVRNCDVYVCSCQFLKMQNGFLDTESLQDQPVGGPDPELAPTDAERNMLGIYTRSYLTLYSDAIKRLSTRKTKDFDAIQAHYSGPFFVPLRTLRWTQGTGLSFDLAGGQSIGPQSSPTR